MSEDIKTDKPATFEDWRVSPQGLCATNEAVMKSEYYMKGRLQNTNCYAMAYKRMQAHLRAAYDSYLASWEAEKAMSDSSLNIIDKLLYIASNGDSSIVQEAAEQTDTTIIELLNEAQSNSVLTREEIALDLLQWVESSAEAMLDYLNDELEENAMCPLCHGSGGCPPELPCIRCGGSGRR